MRRFCLPFFGIVVTLVINVDRYQCYQCKDQIVEVYGKSDDLVTPLFAGARVPFEEFRQTYGLLVDLRTNVEFDHNKNSTLKPFVFEVTHREVGKDTNLVKFPLIGQALQIIYNLPGVKNLNLSISTIVDIYKGTVQYWNDTEIAMYNPNDILPHERILPIARMDDVPATMFLTSVLSAHDFEWSSKYNQFYSPNFAGNHCCNYDKSCCQSKSWPPNVIHKFCNEVVGMVGVVNSVRYSIGYATMNYVKRYDSLMVAHLINNVDNEHFVRTPPNTATIQRAMSDAVNGSKADLLDVNIESSNDPESYPFSALTFIVVNETYSITVDCCVVQELVAFIDWLLFKADETMLESLGYVPLIDELKDRIKKQVLERIKCREGLVYDAYLNTIEKTADSTETWQIAVIAAGSIVGLCLIAAIIYYVIYKRFHVDVTRWMIDASRVKLVQRVTSARGSSKSFDTQSQTSDSSEIPGKASTNRNDHANRAASARSSMRGGAMLKNLKEFMQQGELDENKVYLDTLICKLPTHWSVNGKRAMVKLKNVMNKNLAAFFGVTIIENVPYAIFDHCSKGTLHFVLRASRYHLTEEIKYSFALDISQGLKYLHHYGLVHGYLSSITCYLDSSWSVKIAHWEKLPLYQHENFQHFMEHVSYDSNNMFEEARLIELLYVDPALAKSVKECSDVYSFGFLLLEIFTRKLPYLEEIEEGNESYTNVLNKKFTTNTPVRPMQSRTMSKEIFNLALSCISGEDSRPNISKVCSILNGGSKLTNGIVDLIMDTLEMHADALEEKVEERTAELRQVTDKMRDLLNEVLPVQITEKLLAGIPVLPEQFECITVYFSDIVGFATISATSSPTEVMALLNDLFAMFDNVMGKFDVYKADAIGDTYMVCSGLPIRNGMEHLKQIAFLALALLDSCNRFKIRHMPDEQLKIRIGINSGPATAGVIGSKMPQYCIFGDTVNSASRMESNSLPQKIHVSERYFQFMDANFPGMFDMTFRGEITVKGKGTMRTYWMHGLHVGP